MGFLRLSARRRSILRVNKIISGTTTDYFYVGADLLAEKTGSPEASGWKDYIFFGGQRIAEQTGSTAASAVYLHTDHLGSTRRCTNADGTSAGTCDYEPFGENQPGTSCSVPTRFRFAGMDFDSDTALYHTWFREYDPNQGRWMAVDPLPGSEDDPQTRNRYAYARNDPVNFIDPYGLNLEYGCVWRWSSVTAGGHTYYEEWQECFFYESGGGGGGWSGGSDGGGGVQGGDPPEIPYPTAPPGGPIIPLSSGVPPPPTLECDLGFIQAANEAWTRAMRGDDPINEAVFAIGGSVSSPTYRPVLDAVTVVIPNGLRTTFNIFTGEWATGHTHPNAYAPRPSVADRTQGQVRPTYVISSGGLFVTDPSASDRYRLLRPGLSWQVRCN